MKTHFAVQSQLPGNICIEAETPQECLLLRIFSEWSSYEPDKQFSLKSSTGNTMENIQSILIGWQKKD